MEFDPKEPVQTRDGRKARIICTDYNNPAAAIIALVYSHGYECIYTYNSNGRFVDHMEHSSDLINIPKRKELFANWYGDDFGYCCSHSSYEEALKSAGLGAKGMIKITYENDIPIAFEYIQEDIIYRR